MQPSRIGPANGFSYRQRRYEIGQAYPARVCGYHKLGVLVITGRDGIRGLLKGEDRLREGQRVQVRIAAFFDTGDANLSNDGIRVEFELAAQPQGVESRTTLGPETYGTIIERVKNGRHGRLFFLRPPLQSHRLVVVPDSFMTEAERKAEFGFVYRGTGQIVDCRFGRAEIAFSMKYVNQESKEYSKFGVNAEVKLLERARTLVIKAG